MSSSQHPPESGAELDPTDRIKGFLARQRPEYVGGPITPKEQLEEDIQERRHFNLSWFRRGSDLDELQEGDGRTRGLSDVLPPGEYPSGDVYQYVPRRELREYKYVCENTETRRETRWSVATKERIEVEKEVECGVSFSMECRGLPSQCHRCGGWIRPEDDK